MLPSEQLLTEQPLLPVTFMRLTINSQDLNKAHGHDMISIRMLKLCGEAAC